MRYASEPLMTTSEKITVAVLVILALCGAGYWWNWYTNTHAQPVIDALTKLKADLHSPGLSEDIYWSDEAIEQAAFDTWESKMGDRFYDLKMSFLSCSSDYASSRIHYASPAA